MRQANQAPVYRIVLTGGPCGGKTTCLSHLNERLEALGFRVFLVPEAATLLFTGGASVAEATTDGLIHFESTLIQLQMSLENAFIGLAKSTGEPAVVLCDRGTMDASAYIPVETWQALLDEHGWTQVALRDRRYDAVLHLVTAADGAEAFYTTENNNTRLETPAQARELDRMLKKAWVGHSHLRVIDNSTNFAEKVRRVVATLCRVLSLPAPREIERKFLLRQPPRREDFPVHVETFEIEQTYLVTSDGSETRVRRRGQNGAYAYTYTVKRPVVAGERVEMERQIPGREYLSLLSQADPTRRTVKKQRRCFLWENFYFELDTFIEPATGLAVVEVELDEPNQQVPLPPFLAIEREVTEEKEYSSYHIAART